MYVPGMVWLVIIGVIVRRRNIFEAWQASASKLVRVSSVVLSVAALAPLVYGLARSPSLIKQWLGLVSTPDSSIPSLADIGANLASVPLSLFYKSNFDAVHWLSDLPLLSSFEIVMFLLGLYFYLTHLKASRTRLIVVLAAVSWLLVGIMGQNAISLIVPVIYLVVAAGIAYILHLWLKVFPNNPIARSIGIAVITLAILLTSIYQTRSYFVAWRYNSDTAEAFKHKL
jgi:hypothetical protein